MQTILVAEGGQWLRGPVYTDIPLMTGIGSVPSGRRIPRDTCVLYPILCDRANDKSHITDWLFMLTDAPFAGSGVFVLSPWR